MWVMVLCILAVPLTLNTGLETVSFWVPKQSLATVLWSIKLSVAPVSKSLVSSAMP